MLKSRNRRWPFGGQWDARLSPQLLEATEAGATGAVEGGATGAGEGALFWRAKRVFDVTFCALAAPVVLAVAALVLLGNLLANRGPLLFWQERMGRDCRPFRMVKFRTMRPIDRIERGPEDPLEADRITPFGAFLRRTKIDELPQIWNVLTGEMSLIGPRPDYLPHALAYLETVPGYGARHEVPPGITGLAQMTTGYAQGAKATAAKVRMDLAYARNAGLALEAIIFLRTLRIGVGARRIRALRLGEHLAGKG